MTQSGFRFPNRLYAIADADAFGVARLPRLVSTWARAGVGTIQLRMKGADNRQLRSVGRECKQAVDGNTSQLWINDSVEVARDLEVTGVHLGQDDVSPQEARRLLGDGQLIGRSTHNQEQAEAAFADGNVDVVALGPVFSTLSKADPDPVTGVEALRRVVAVANKPVVAIGGIDHNNCRLPIDAGADAVAVIGALTWKTAVDDGGVASDESWPRLARSVAETLLTSVGETVSDH